MSGTVSALLRLSSTAPLRRHLCHLHPPHAPPPTLHDLARIALEGNTSSLELASSLLKKSATAFRPVVDGAESALDAGAARVAASVGLETWEVELFVLLAVAVVVGIGVLAVSRMDSYSADRLMQLLGRQEHAVECAIEHDAPIDGRKLGGGRSRRADTKGGYDRIRPTV